MSLFTIFAHLCHIHASSVCRAPSKNASHLFSPLGSPASLILLALLTTPMDLPSLPAPQCKPGRAAAVTFPCTFSSSLQCRRDQSRCRIQGLSNFKSTPWHQDVPLSLSSAACTSLGRSLRTKVSTMALGAPSRAAIAPSNLSLLVQSQQVKCWD